VFIIIGFLVVFGSVIGGFMIAGGKIAVLMHIAEYIIIIGAALGAMVVANPVTVIKKVFTECIALLKPSRYTEAAYAELLVLLHKIFMLGQKDGLMGLEPHVENPQNSTLFNQHPTFAAQPQAVAFLADTVKILLTDNVEDHLLTDILEMDLEQYHEEAMQASNAITKVSEGLPAFGIVAAVLGMIITMGSIGGAATEIGAKVAAAMVGTFLGIFLAYGFAAPLAHATATRVHAEMAYLRCIRTGMLAFARGDKPTIALEFARRSVEPHGRPSFQELEDLTRNKAAA
jgi:chemotaxis protein MotA